jgi:hypothetical protein
MPGPFLVFCLGSQATRLQLVVVLQVSIVPVFLTYAQGQFALVLPQVDPVSVSLLALDRNA